MTCPSEREKTQLPCAYEKFALPSGSFWTYALANLTPSYRSGADAHTVKLRENAHEISFLSSSSSISPASHFCLQSLIFPRIRVVTQRNEGYKAREINHCTRVLCHNSAARINHAPANRLVETTLFLSPSEKKNGDRPRIHQVHGQKY